MRVGFALQLTTLRWLGTFLEDPLDVPGEVLDFIVGQLGMADPSQVKRYTEREETRFDHQCRGWQGDLRSHGVLPVGHMAGRENADRPRRSGSVPAQARERRDRV
jgi:hypothetical protein